MKNLSFLYSIFVSILFVSNSFSLTLKELESIPDVPYYTGNGGVANLKILGINNNDLYFLILHINDIEAEAVSLEFFKQNLDDNVEKRIGSFWYEINQSQYDLSEQEYYRLLLNNMSDSLRNKIKDAVSSYEFLNIKELPVIINSSDTMRIDIIEQTVYEETFGEKTTATLLIKDNNGDLCYKLQLSDPSVIGYDFSGYFNFPDKKKAVFVLYKRLTHENFSVKFVGFEYK